MKFCFTYLYIFFLPFLSNARNVQEAFISMPANMFMDISIENRIDLINTYEAKTKATIQNNFQEDIRIENMTEDYLLLNSGNSNLQIIVLPAKNDAQLYCLIYTVCGPICDSRIEFYSLSWKQLDRDSFISITPQNWFINETDKFPELAISFMQFNYNQKEKILIQTNNSPQYLSMEDQEKIKPFIKQEKREYKWNGTKFQGIKEK